MREDIIKTYNEFLKMEILDKMILLTILFYGIFSTINRNIINISNVLLLLFFLKKKAIRIKLKNMSFFDKILIFYFLLIGIRFIINDGKDIKTSILAKYLIPILLFYIVRSLSFLGKFFNLIFSMFFISMFASLIFSYIDKCNGVSRVNGFIFVMEFAEFAAMLSVLSLILVLFKLKKKSYKIIISMIAVGSFISMIMTKTRGVWLAYILTIIIVLFLKNKKYLVCFLLSGLLFLSFVFGTNIFKNNQYYKRFKSIGNVETNSSNTTRLRLWKGSVDIIKDNIYFGIGFNNFSKEIKKEKYNYGKIVSRAHAHNNYLQVGLSTGLIGMILLIIIHIYVIYYFILNYRHQEDENIKLMNIILLSFWTIYIFHGLTEVTIEDTYTSRFIWVLMGLANIINKPQKEVV